VYEIEVKKREDDEEKSGRSALDHGHYLFCRCLCVSDADAVSVILDPLEDSGYALTVPGSDILIPPKDIFEIDSGGFVDFVDDPLAELCSQLMRLAVENLIFLLVSKGVYCSYEREKGREGKGEREREKGRERERGVCI
jgi:hypothetical protein